MSSGGVLWHWTLKVTYSLPDIIMYIFRFMPYWWRIDHFKKATFYNYVWIYRSVQIEKTSVILHCCQCWQEHETASWLKKHKRRLDQLEAQTYNRPSGLLTTPRLKGCTLSHPQWLPALVMIGTWLSWLSHDCHMIVTLLSHDCHDCHMIVMTVTPWASWLPSTPWGVLKWRYVVRIQIILTVFFFACINKNVIAEVM